MNEKIINRDIHGKEYSKLMLIITIIVGSFIAVLNQTILSTALPSLMKYFNIETSTVQWVTTAYMLTNGIMIPLTALLLEKVSTKKLYIFSMSAFGIGTLLCAFSPSFGFLLGGRIVQAVGAGILMPLVNTLLILVFPKEKRGFAMGLYGLVISFAPAIGPTLSGLIVDKFDWHYIFYIIIPIIIIDLIISGFFMKDIIPNKNPKIDFISIISSTLGFGALLYGFSIAGNEGWSNPIVIDNIVIGLVMSGLFVLRQLKSKQPMLELRVFKSRTFTLTTIIGCILTIAQAGSTIIIPIFLQNILGKSAFTSGLIVLPGALIMACMTVISGRIFDKYGANKIVISGIILVIISSIPFTFLSINTTSLTVCIFYAIRFMGIGLIIMPLQTEGFNSLDNRFMAHATASVNMTKQISGSIGTAVLITIMTNITALNAPATTLSNTDVALYQSQMIDANIMGMNVTFMCVMLVTIVALILSFSLKKKNKK